MSRGRITERTFYPALMNVIRAVGGSGVQEVTYNSTPDIVFNLEAHQWLLSVKIGHDRKTMKEAFLQYLHHKEESKINFGILLLLPESIRNVHLTEEDVESAVRKIDNNIAFIDASFVKEEIRNWTFPQIISFLKEILNPSGIYLLFSSPCCFLVTTGSSRNNGHYYPWREQQKNEHTSQK